MKTTFQKTIVIATLALFGLSNVVNGQWSQTSCPDSAAIYALATDQSTIYAGTGSSGADGYGIYQSVDNGSNWSNPGSGTSDKYVEAIFVTGNRILAGTKDGTGGVY